MRVHHYVKFLFPGVFVSEESIKEVGHREARLLDVPEEAFAFRFMSREESDGEHGRMNGPWFDLSGIYYPGGELLTLEDIPDTDDNRILRSNMKSNGWDPVMRTRKGNYQPFEKEDTIL